MVKGIEQTTAGIASRERWDYWKDTTLTAVDANACGDTASFMARRTIMQAATATLIETASEPFSIKRPRRKIASDGIDHACLVLALAGSGVINQINRPDDVLRTGDIILYDLGRPYTAASLEPYHELRLYVPRDLFARRVGRIETLSGLQLKGRTGLTELFTSYLAAYAATLPNLSQEEADVGMDGVLHLLSGLVKSSVSMPGGANDTLSRGTLLALALRHIEVLLGDPMLDVTRLARAIGVSRSRLYDAFIERGGVASVIREVRLDRARLRLAAPEERHLTLEQIARSCGFSDYGTFTRAFLRRFGASPNSVRAEALAGLPENGCSTGGRSSPRPSMAARPGKRPSAAPAAEAILRGRPAPGRSQAEA